jgi:hypothetical protein
MLSSPSLPWSPTSRCADPWWDLYLPAACGDRKRVQRNLSAYLDDASDGNAHAIAARALLTLGRNEAAEAAYEVARTRGGDEADALATWIAHDGDSFALRRVTTAPRAGQRADAACDVLCRKVLAGEVDDARALLSEAEALCPGHAEVARWRRVLADPCARTQVHAAGRGRAAIRADAAGAIDAFELVPRRQTGWVSEERLRRRVIAAPFGGSWADPTTALGQLQDRGLYDFLFAVESEYAELPAGHPLVTLETLADQVRARVHERRPAVMAARTLLAAARAVDEIAEEDAANLIVTLATLDETLIPLGWSVAHRELKRDEEGTLWRAYRAWFAAVMGRGEALADAQSVLAERWPSGVEAMLAVAALQVVGEPHQIEAALAPHHSRREFGPLRAAVARGALHAPRCFVSARLAARGLQTAH